MDCTYSVFGLYLRSNVPIPGLKLAEKSPCEPDVLIHICTSPGIAEPPSLGREELAYVSAYTDESGEPALRVWQIAHGAFLRLAYYDGVQFWLDRAGTNVWALWPETFSFEDAATYLVGPVLGVLLRLRGVTCLHASAVALGNHAVVFVGSEGAGKSTTAAAMAQRGYAVLSDDVVALIEEAGCFSVLPAYPHLCLWPESVKLLYGEEKSLPSISPGWGKRLLSLGGDGLKFEKKPLPLGALFILGERTANHRTPWFESLTQKEGFLSLVANSFATNLLDAEMRSREFSFLGRMLGAVPIRRIRARQGAKQIEDLCRTVVEEFDHLHAKPYSTLDPWEAR